MTRKQLIKQLYSEGYSSYDLGTMFSLSQGTIIRYLKGNTRPILGKIIEKKVYKFLKAKGSNVKEMPGKHPYDLLVDGFKVDIKSSNTSNKFGYYFEIQHQGAKPKDNHEIDYFFFVFNRKTLYRSKTTEFKSDQKGTRMREDDDRLEYLGELDQ